MTIAQKKKITPTVMQKKCIETLDGPVMVLAGPGTGKTFTVVGRIKNMLEKGIKPESILCLTFSEPASSEMKTRLFSEIGALAQGLEINTYHAFCANIIRQYPSKFELLDEVEVIDEIGKYNLVKKAIDAFNPVFFRNKWGDSDFYIDEVAKLIDEVKKNRLNKEDYFNNIEKFSDWKPALIELEDKVNTKKQKGKTDTKTDEGKIERIKTKIGKAVELWDIYEIYQAELHKRGFIDFNDMINLVLEMLEKDNELLTEISSSYKYLLIDEYQDNSANQNQLIFELAKGANHQNIFVVGDDDQIIYSFRGAQTKNLEEFLDKYPQTQVICLDENRRSTQTILDLGYKVIEKDLFRLENIVELKKYNISKKLIAKNQEVIEKNKKVKLWSFSTAEQEKVEITNEIQRLIEEEKIDDLKKIAILARNNDTLDEFAHLLESKDISFQIRKSKSIFEIKPSILVYFYLKALYNNVLYSDTLFGLLLSEPFSFDKEDYNYILGLQKLYHKDFITLIKENLDYDWKQKDKVNEFIDTYNELSNMKSYLKLTDLIVLLLNKTKILQFYLNSSVNKFDNISGINRFIKEAKSLQKVNKTLSLKEFIDHLDLAYKASIKLEIEKDSKVINAIQLSTLHSSKGREFEYVFMPELSDKKWEKSRVSNQMAVPVKKNSFSEDKKEAKEAEERRLLFVGITRAKHDLYLSYSLQKDTSNQDITSYLPAFSDNKELYEYKNFELSQEKQLEFSLGIFEKKNYNFHKHFEFELSKRIDEIVLSHTTLNLYSSCARKFLYKEIYKVPEYQENKDNLNYGNAVHESLYSCFFNAKETGSYPSKEKLKEIFENSFAQKEFSSQEQRELYKKRGDNFIENYYHRFIATSIKNVLAQEYRLDNIDIKGYKIKGFIDRVEKNDFGEYEIYDFKTGSAKSEKEIRDRKDNNHLDQLQFYKMAFELQNKGANVTKVGIVYLEEPEKSLSFELTEQDNQEIKEKILETYKNLKEQNFEPVDYEMQKAQACKYCSFKLLCKLNVI